MQDVAENGQHRDGNGWQQQQDLAEQRTKNDRKWPKKQGKVHVQLSLGLNVHTPREVVTF
jgi:hypothetical protein